MVFSIYPGMSAGSSCVYLLLVSYISIASWLLIPQQEMGKIRHIRSTGQKLRGWSRCRGEARETVLILPSKELGHIGQASVT